MGEREKIYTRDEAAELILLWEEIEEWGDDRRFNRWGRKAMSARMIHEVAEERGIKVAATGKAWAYETALRVLQIAGKMPQRTGNQRKRRKKGAEPASPKSTAGGAGKSTAGAVKSAEVTLQRAVSARVKEATTTAQWLATATPPKSEPGPSPIPEPDLATIYAAIERDLGAFLRPEDRQRAHRTSSAENARKLQELAIDLAAKTESRARLAVYVSVYDRLIARITHRFEMIREKGADPDDEDQREEQQRRAEDEELYGVHAEVMPLSVVRRRP